MPSNEPLLWVPARSCTSAICPRICSMAQVTGCLKTTKSMSLDELERRAILRALRESGGDKLAAARLLGIGKTTLYRKLKQYGAQAQTN